MSDPLLAELKASILKNLGTLERQVESLQAALDRDLALLGRTQNAALIVVGLLENYYACLETAFLRISQFFENTLDPERWRTDLLEKMTLHIEGCGYRQSRRPIIPIFWSCSSSAISAATISSWNMTGTGWVSWSRK